MKQTHTDAGMHGVLREHAPSPRYWQVKAWMQETLSWAELRPVGFDDETWDIDISVVEEEGQKVG
jgi:hypothetical protein